MAFSIPAASKSATRRPVELFRILWVRGFTMATTVEFAGSPPMRLTPITRFDFNRHTSVSHPFPRQ